MRVYKSHLMRRLILETSADNEMEEMMVDRLRVSHSKTCPAVKDNIYFLFCVILIVFSSSFHWIVYYFQ